MKLKMSVSRVVYPVVLALLLALFPAAAWAQDGAPGVYYEYTQIAVGDAAQFALLPRESGAFSSVSPPQVAIPRAFQVLREAKRATYGSASVTLSDADLEAGRVVVHLDPAQMEYAQIVVAETVYTFTGLGVGEVVFPALEGAVYSRADVPFAAFVMHLPLWRALPPARAEAAVITLPDGSSLPSAEFYARWEAGDAALREQLLAYLERGDALTRRNVLGRLTQLAEQGDTVPGALEAVEALLDAERSSLRLQAVAYLARAGGERGLERLTALVASDPDPEVQAAAAQALGASGDAQFQYFELVHALEAALPEQMPAALSDLAATGDGRAVDTLVPYLEHDQAAVREAAIEGLQRLGATGRLAQALEDPALAEAVRHEVATRLSTSPGGAQVRALEHLVGSQEGQAAINALFRLRGATPEGDAIDAIERQLDHPDATVRSEAARLLGQLGGAEALEVLGRRAGHEEDAAVRDQLDQAAFGLMSRLPREQVSQHAEGRDRFLKRAAFRALAELAQAGQGGAEVARTLRQGLSDEEAGVRGAAVLALASYGSAEVYEAIAPLAGDTDPGVRRDVARSLVHFEGELGQDLLSQFLTDPEEPVVAAALTAIGERGDRGLLPQVMTAVQRRQPEVRAAALVAASQLAVPEVQQTIIDSLMGATNDRSPEVRAAAARALASFDNELAILGVSPLTEDRELTVRLAAIEALGATTSDSALGVLTGLLRDRNPEVRLAVISALSEMGNTEAVSDIEAAVAAETEAPIVEAGRQAIERLRQP